MSRTIPVPSEPLLTRSGQINPIWWRYLRSIESQGDSSGVQEQIREILRRLAEIPEAREVIGRMSVVVIDQPDGTRSVQLEGDSLTPGSNAFYCTDPIGRRQWATLSQMIGASDGIVFTDSGYTVMGAVDSTDDLPALGNAGEAWWVGNVLYAWNDTDSEWQPDYSPSGLLELTLSEITPEAGGTLQKTAFDAKGRRTHEAAATTDDLPEGATNLYFPEAPEDGRPYVRKDGEWEVGGGGAGSEWHNGTGAPSGSLGDDGDYYLDADTGDVYAKESGAWSLVGNIEGPPGPPGDPSSVPGPAGPPGPSSSCFPTASFDGGSGAIHVGAWCEIYVPFGFEVTAWTLVGSPLGNIVIDVRSALYGTYPPLPGDSICGVEAPRLSGDIKSQDSDLSDWPTTEVSSGSVIRFHVTACEGVARATLTLEGVRS